MSDITLLYLTVYTKNEITVKNQFLNYYTYSTPVIMCLNWQNKNTVLHDPQKYQSVG